MSIMRTCGKSWWCWGWSREDGAGGCCKEHFSFWDTQALRKPGTRDAVPTHQAPLMGAAWVWEDTCTEKLPFMGISFVTWCPPSQGPGSFKVILGLVLTHPSPHEGSLSICLLYSLGTTPHPSPLEGDRYVTQRPCLLWEMWHKTHVGPKAFLMVPETALPSLGPRPGEEQRTKNLLSSLCILA